MRRRLAVLLTAALLASPGGVGAEEVSDAGAVTQPGRGLDRALDQVLAGPGPAVGGKRTVLLLVDATRTLKEAAFADRLGQSLQRQAPALRGTSVGLARCGAKGLVTVPPGDDRQALLSDLTSALATAAANPVRNLYADVRAAAGSFSGEGERRLVVVSLDNGDVEDDLEDTVRALTRARVACDVITRESYLGDSYAWSHAAQVKVPKDTTWTGGDGGWPEIPWGWLFQQYQGNENAPSGFAPFGLSRLAAASGGRVHLYAAPGGKHECSVLGGCPFCSQDHLPQGESYLPHRVKALAPALGSRDEVLAQDARDPWVRLTLGLWEQAGKEGLLRSRPPVALGAGGLKPEPRRSTGSVPLVGGGLNLPRLAKEAARLREAGERLLVTFEADLAKIEPTAGSARHRASAETARVLLHLTLANLALFEGWCLGAGPALVGKAEHEMVPPEVPRLGPEYRIVGWSYSTHCLCHGLAPYRAQRLSVGPEFAARLDALDAVLKDFFARYDHTPFGIAIRRSGLATFVPTVQGKVIPPPEKRGGSTETSDEPVTTDRPGRSGGGSGESGPATTK